MNQRTQIEELRAISLPALLVWHGFVPRPEGQSYRVHNDRYNLVVTDCRWFDNRAGTGGGGASDLQMYLLGPVRQTSEARRPAKRTPGNHSNVLVAM